MKELVIYIDSCYINANKENIQDTVHSINKNLYGTNEGYLYGMGGNQRVAVGNMPLKTRLFLFDAQ